jgi:hypothetical protein
LYVFCEFNLFYTEIRALNLIPFPC